MTRTRLTHATLVLRDEIVRDGSLTVEDGVIESVGSPRGAGCREISLGGAWLLPGLVDLHCDAIEKDAEPRPNVFFPFEWALENADSRNALAGVSTCHHAIAFGDGELGLRTPERALRLIGTIRRRKSVCMTDHRVQIRYEITDPKSFEPVMNLLDDDDIQAVSLMDHTPGQGQFKDALAYKEYFERVYKTSPEELDTRIVIKRMEGARAAERIRAIAEKALAKNKLLVSHDDDSAGRVGAMHAHGVRLCEFPVNFEAAEAAKRRGMTTLFGAPNAARGKSQSGSLSVREAIEKGLADCLCSDYHPGSMLQAVFAIAGLGLLDLPAAARLASLNPARAAGLEDRGEIAPGKRADLVAVRSERGHPVVTALWVGGRPAFAINGGGLPVEMDAEDAIGAETR